ncbi:MAG: DUF2232 domain-containing protein [Deltaproteobacteria bacterium]|nr:DUF2232 domain-containing protein [Deltaproteobacteria bacterium]
MSQSHFKKNLKTYIECLFYACASSFLFATLVGALLAPAPHFYILAKKGKPFALLSFALSSILTLFIMNNMNAFLIYSVFVGSFLVFVMLQTSKKVLTSQLILQSTGLSLFILSFFLISKVGLNYENIHHGLTTYIQSSQKILNAEPRFLEKLNKNVEIKKMWKQPHEMATGILNQAPSYIIAFSLLFALINILLLRKWSTKLFSKKENLKMWKAPEFMIWVLIVSFLPIIFDKEPFVVIGSNFLRVCLFIYFLQGLSVFSFMFERRKLPFLFQILFLALLSLINIPLPTGEDIFSHILINLPMMIGFCDVWFDFRNRYNNASKRSLL